MSLRTGGSSRGNDGTMKTSLGDNIDLDSGITARIVDRPGVDLGDRHLVLFSEDGSISGEPGI
jgi:hypothetical protein